MQDIVGKAQVVQITLTMALFYSCVRVTVSQHAQYIAELNSATIHHSPSSHILQWNCLSLLIICSSCNPALALTKLLIGLSFFFRILSHPQSTNKETDFAHETAKQQPTVEQNCRTTSAIKNKPKQRKRFQKQQQ